MRNSLASLLRPSPLVALLAALGSACAVESPEDVDLAAQLDGRVFLGSEDADGAPLDLVAGTELRLAFEGPRISASAGCNGFSGRFTIEDGVLVVPGGSVTEMGCEVDLMDQETWYFAFLTDDPAIELSGDALTLDDGQTSVAYLDQEVATPDLELVGPTWEVDTLIDGDAASTPPVGAGPATLVFADDGTVAVDTGCNTGTASWALEGADLRFADLALTEIGCDAPAMELEAAVAAVIGSPDPVAWEIRVHRLDLIAGDVGISLTGTP